MNSPDTVARLNVALQGRYRIEREIGEGGMVTVYLADDLKHERKVALKVLKPELAAVVGAERFLAEIETMANLQHPHILPLHDSGEADGFLFYVMPYVEGDVSRTPGAPPRRSPLGVPFPFLSGYGRNGSPSTDGGPMRFQLWSLLLVLVLAGCGAVVAASGGGNSNSITSEQLREADAEGLNVYQIIERNRPQWFRAGRAAPTLGRAAGGESFARVVLDGRPYGEIDALRRLDTVSVESIEYIRASDATTRFGTGYSGGAILVRMH